uniref:Uncharacterized protein n=1 Tax=Eutreptiella gymnastica TaxID=73025 RepID=A0A7S1J7U2_9EUGL
MEKPAALKPLDIYSVLSATYGATEFVPLADDSPDMFFLHVTEKVATKIGPQLTVSNMPVYVRYNPKTRTSSAAPSPSYGPPSSRGNLMLRLWRCTHLVQLSTIAGQLCKM